MPSQPPFRWNIARREQLGGLIDGDLPNLYAEFHSDLKDIAANICAASEDRTMVFVGRSLEYVHDYLLGLLEGARSIDQPRLLQYSAPTSDITPLTAQNPEAFAALYEYFSELELSPKALLKRDTPVVLVDIVASGATFASIVSLISHWSASDQLDISAVLKKVGVLGLTRRTKNSPNTQRWWQHAPWTDLSSLPASTSLSIEPRFWNFVGNTDGHTTPSHRMHRWHDDEREPQRQEARLAALRLSRSLYQLGQQPEERKQFLKCLAANNSRVAGQWTKAVSVARRRKG